MDERRNVPDAVYDPGKACEQLVDGEPLDVDTVDAVEGRLVRAAPTQQGDLVTGLAERGGFLFHPDVRREAFREQHADMHLPDPRDGLSVRHVRGSRRPVFALVVARFAMP